MEMTESYSPDFEALREHGPLPSTDDRLRNHPTFTYLDKDSGLRKFRPAHSNRGSSLNTGGYSHTVYYIKDSHDPKTVVKRWLEANQDIVEHLPARALHARICNQGDQFKDPSRQLLGDRKGFPTNPSGTQNHDTKACPLCETDGLRHLPNHLPDCPER